MVINDEITSTDRLISIYGTWYNDDGLLSDYQHPLTALIRRDGSLWLRHETRAFCEITVDKWGDVVFGAAIFTLAEGELARIRDAGAKV